MKYSCIGEHLKHSFSKEIHSLIGDYEYELFEVSRGEIDEFLKKRDFLGINVTIPYKETVIPYLYEIDPRAKEIGAVNTIVNKGGLLFGYNTDFYGMKSQILHAGIDISGKRVYILGTGGTSKTAMAVAKHLGACEIIRVSRTKSEAAISYEDMYEAHATVDIIINTTPVGMYPNNYKKAVDITKFENLSGVVDVVYNPLTTALVADAKKIGIPAVCGLYMLVGQAIRASEIFMDTKYKSELYARIFEAIKSRRQNIVLTGMPASGKSTVGALIARSLNREFFDTDSLIEEREKMSIPDIFTLRGEEYFREVERRVIAEISKTTGAVISTGGGAILSPANVSALRANGRIYFIDRPKEKLIPSSNRPLANDKEKILLRYSERYGIYLSTSDMRIDADKEPSLVAKDIMEDFENENIRNQRT